MNDKIKSILNNDEDIVENVKDEEEITLEEEVSLVENEDTKIITTEEEIEGFNIVRSILSEVVKPEDISYKDVERYCGILYQNNTRKWICRLYFNSSKKSIVISDEDKNGVRYQLETVSDIYKYKNELLKSIDKYLKKVDA